MAKKDSAAETNSVTPSRGKAVPGKEGNTFFFCLLSNILREKFVGQRDC